jgi:hypothetical protein
MHGGLIVPGARRNFMIEDIDRFQWFIRVIIYTIVEIGRLLLERGRDVSIANWIIVACAVTGFWVIIKMIIRWIILSAMGVAGSYIFLKMLIPAITRYAGA